jgi:hypothetical protein
VTDDRTTERPADDSLMGRFETIGWIRGLERTFFPLSVLGAGAAVYAVYLVAGPSTAIKGSYALFGLLLAAATYYGAREGNLFSTFGRDRGLRTITVTLLALSLPLTLFTGSRLPALLTVVPLGFLFVWLQMRSESTASILAQLTGLYLLSPVTKLLTSGLYFENGDVFDHVRYVDVLLSTGSFQAIPRYGDYPGYHLLTGTVSLLTGLSPYHAMVVVQLTLFATLIPAVYLLARVVFDSPRLALFPAFALAVIYTAVRYATVFFPESIAVVLVVFVLYLSFRIIITAGETHWSFYVLVATVGAATILTHHLTILIAMPFAGVVVLGGLLLRRTEDGLGIGPQPLPLVMVGFASVSYWIYERDFVLELWYFAVNVFFGTAASSGEEWRVVVGLGRRLPELTPRSAAWSLASAEGIYFILLVAVVALGVVHVLSSRRAYRRTLHLVAAGVLTAPLLLRTPLAPDYSRIRFPLVVFFAFVVGAGLDRLSRVEFDLRWLRVVPVLFVVVLGTTGGLVASHDLYAFHAGPDLYELAPLDEPEVEYSKVELQELRETARFVRGDGEETSTLGMTGRALDMFGVPAGQATVTEGEIRTDRERFVYRDAWTSHRLSIVRDGRIATLVMSRTWLERSLATEHKVYTAGGTGVLWSPGGGRIGPNVGPNGSISAADRSRFDG